MSNTNVRNFVFGNSDLFRIADETNIDAIFEHLRAISIRRKGLDSDDM